MGLSPSASHCRAATSAGQQHAPPSPLGMISGAMATISERRSVRFSLRTLFIIVSLAAVGLAWSLRPPAVRLIVDRPRLVVSSDPADVQFGLVSIDYPVRLVNGDGSQFWYRGWPTFKIPIYAIESKDPSGNWRITDAVRCDVGSELIPLDPGTTTKFVTAIDPKCFGEEFRLTMSVCKREGDRYGADVQLVSNPVKVPTVRELVSSAR